MSNIYEEYSPPWAVKPLSEWSICGMNHYFVDGNKRLFVAMTKNGRCIVEEGQESVCLWNRLRKKATEPDKR